MSPEDNAFVDVMTRNIVYWRGIHAPITTPTGKPKKIPWFLIVRCTTHGHLHATSMSRSVGMRFRCQRDGYRPGKGSVKCESKVEIVEVEDMEARFGLSAEEAKEIQDAWTTKYA